MSDLQSGLVSNESVVMRERYPRLHRVRTFLKQFDLFSFTPSPRFIREKQVSLRGLIGSIVTLLIIVAYFGLTLERFLNGSPSVSQVQNPPSADPLDFVPIGMVFRINDAQLVPRKVFYNESYFKYLSSVTQVTEQDRYPRHIKTVPMAPCDVSSWAGWLGEFAMCPVNSLQVQGRYQSPNYTFSRIDVVLCDPAHPYNDSVTGLPVACASWPEQSAVIQEGRFNLLQAFISQVPDVDSSWEAHMYLVNPNVWSQYEQSYAVRYTTVNADYLRSWTDSEYNSMELVSEKFFSRLPANPSGGGRYLLTIYFRLGSFNVQEERQVQTSMDLAGQVWAFFGLVLSIFALYFASYNESKFYDENPGWDEIDSQFRSKHDREQEMVDVKSLGDETKK